MGSSHSRRHCEKRSDEANQPAVIQRWTLDHGGLDGFTTFAMTETEGINVIPCYSKCFHSGQISARGRFGFRRTKTASPVSDGIAYSLTTSPTGSADPK